jgi:hypothetical protein
MRLFLILTIASIRSPRPLGIPNPLGHFLANAAPAKATGFPFCVHDPLLRSSSGSGAK